MSTFSSSSISDAAVAASSSIHLTVVAGRRCFNDRADVSAAVIRPQALSSSSCDRRTPSSNGFFEDNQTLSSIDCNDSVSMSGVAAATTTTTTGMVTTMTTAAAANVMGGALKLRLPGGSILNSNHGSGECRQSVSDDDSGCALIDEYRYAWVPAGLRQDLIHQYFNSLPQDKVTYVNSAGEKWRFKQLVYQCPPQDTEPRYCRHLNDYERKAMKKFTQQRKNEAFGHGVVKALNMDADGLVCNFCSKRFFSGDLAVFLEKNSTKNAPFDTRKTVRHPHCFVCRTCNELLVDLTYFQNGSHVYCGRHYGEIFKPRCVACDELIFADECTEADNRTYHVDHFLCFSCDCPLGGSQYVTHNSRPYCLHCFNDCFSAGLDSNCLRSDLLDVCATCQTVISAQETKLNHGHVHGMRRTTVSPVPVAIGVC